MMRTKRWSTPLILTGIFLSCVCFFVAWRIEWFNEHSGNELPRAASAGKWRFASPATYLKDEERLYRAELSQHAADEGRAFDFDQPLTPQQMAEIRERSAPRVEAARIRNDFRDFVYSWGLYQYLFTLILLVMGFLCLCRKHRGMRACGLLFIGISIYAIALMLHRDYLGAMLG